MKINNTVLDVLGNCRVEENILYLPANLDRKVYTDVNKVLELLAVSGTAGQADTYSITVPPMR